MTFRARHYFNELLKDPMTNQSRIPKFDVHTLVTGPFRGVGVVDRNEGSVLKGEDEVCWIRRREHGKVIQAGYHESKLRRITRLHYFGYVHPDHGTPYVGKTPGIEWWGQFAPSLFVIWMGYHWIDRDGYGWNTAGKLILYFIGAFRIITLVRGTLRNYNGKQA